MAFEHLDAKVLQPGEQFNFNRYLMGLRGYCKGLGNNDFLFYGGVCGVASQLFRSGLSAPQVRIDQRWGHNNWYSKYYGEHVEGDDAAVYERNKWLTFTNTAQRPMMIKVWNQGDETVLFFVIEADAVQGQWVQITKQKHSHLAVDLSKQVYQVRDQQGVWCAPQLGKITALQPFDCDLEEDAHLL